MRKFRCFLLAALIGATGAVVVVSPAHASEQHSYYGNRGHAWSNSAATRVGAEDQRDDGIRIYAEILFACIEHDRCPENSVGGYKLLDPNNNEPGRGLWEALPGYRVIQFRVCGRLNGHTAPRGCGDFVRSWP